MNIEDVTQLTSYLREKGHIGAREQLVVRLLEGGVSNRTVWVGRENGKDLVVKQALEKLRVKEDWFSDPARIHREAEGIRLLERMAPPGRITPLVFEDHDHLLLAMEAVPAPHTNWKEDLLQGNVDTDIVGQFGQCIGQIHATFQTDTYPVDGLVWKQDFFESLRVEPYYQFAAQQVPAAQSFLHKLISDTRELQLTLVHGDYSPKNILVHDGQLVLLDHEVIHIGDPAFDIGFSMAHLLGKAHHLPAYRAAFISAARLYWTTYCTSVEGARWLSDPKSFGNFEQRTVRHSLGCMLARVAGRSPLEYLSDDEKTRQQAAVIALMNTLPDSLESMMDQFAEKLETS